MESHFLLAKGIRTTWDSFRHAWIQTHTCIQTHLTRIFFYLYVYFLGYVDDTANRRKREREHKKFKSTCFYTPTFIHSFIHSWCERGNKAKTRERALLHMKQHLVTRFRFFRINGKNLYVRICTRVTEWVSVKCFLLQMKACYFPLIWIIGIDLIDTLALLNFLLYSLLHTTAASLIEWWKWLYVQKFIDFNIECVHK